MEKQDESKLGEIRKLVDGLEVKFDRIYSKLAENYAFRVPAGWHILLDQLGKVLKGSNERYPFGGEETEATRKMKAVYKDIVARQFPELVKT